MELSQRRETPMENRNDILVRVEFLGHETGPLPVPLDKENFKKEVYYLFTLICKINKTIYRKYPKETHRKKHMNQPC
jgi:hypothetical protein